MKQSSIFKKAKSLYLVTLYYDSYDLIFEEQIACFDNQNDAEELVELLYSACKEQNYDYVNQYVENFNLAASDDLSQIDFVMEEIKLYKKHELDTDTFVDR